MVVAVVVVVVDVAAVVAAAVGDGKVIWCKQYIVLRACFNKSCEWR